MVKVIKNPEKSRKTNNGIKKPGKQKAIIKTKKSADGNLKEKLIKKIKDSKDLTSNVQKTIQLKVEKVEKKKKLKEIKQKNTLDHNQYVIETGKNKVKKVHKSATKRNVGNRTNKQVGNKTNKPANKTSTKIKLEATKFQEEQFECIVSLENIRKICKALKKLVEDEVTEKKTSIFSDYRYFLNVASYKIPNCPKRMVKLDLKHSLVDPNEDDIVLIVPDLQRGTKVDYEPTIQHYEDLLQECGVTGLKIIPFNQLRNEYTTFEAKRKLANTYDYFLCDGRIAGHVVGFCGKTFQKPRTTIHAVHLNDPQKYKVNIEKALKRTSFKQLHKGDQFSIPVGSHRFTINQLVENIKFVINQLKRLFPGGYANVRNMYMKIDIKGTSALPLYVNLAGAPAETPNVIGPREKRLIRLKKQANDVLSKFSLSKTGDFVKLNKSQAERKQNIREARAVLLTKENDINGTPLAKKIKKNKDLPSTSQNEESEVDNAEDLSGLNSEDDDNRDYSENSD